MNEYHVLLLTILISQCAIFVAVIVTYRKKMAILNNYEKITASWRELLHDSRDLLNAAKMWAYVGAKSQEKTTEAAKQTTVAVDEIKQVIKEKTNTGE